MLNWLSVITITFGAVIVFLLWGPPRRTWKMRDLIFVQIARRILGIPNTQSADRMLHHFDQVRKWSLRNIQPLHRIKQRRSGKFRNLVFDEQVKIPRLDLEFQSVFPQLFQQELQPQPLDQLEGEWLYCSDNEAETTSESLLFRQLCASSDQRVVLYLHGGAFCLMSPQTHRFTTCQTARYLNALVIAIDYRLAPEYPFPAALFDALSAWIWLIRDCSIPSSRIVVCGDSAGGGLAFSLSMLLRDYSRELCSLFSLPHGSSNIPAGIIGISPWLDLTMNGASIELNSESDYLSSPYSKSGFNTAWLYVDGVANLDKIVAKDRTFLSQLEARIKSSPYISPLHATSFQDLPPVLILVGSAEILLSDAVEMYAHLSQISNRPLEWSTDHTCRIIDSELNQQPRKSKKSAEQEQSETTSCLSKTGAPVRVEVYRDQVHTFLMFPHTAHRKLAFHQMALWANTSVKAWQSSDNAVVENRNGLYLMT